MAEKVDFGRFLPLHDLAPTPYVGSEVIFSPISVKIMWQSSHKLHSGKSLKKLLHVEIYFTPHTKTSLEKVPKNGPNKGEIHGGPKLCKMLIDLILNHNNRFFRKFRFDSIFGRFFAIFGEFSGFWQKLKTVCEVPHMMGSTFLGILPLKSEVRLHFECKSPILVWSLGQTLHGLHKKGGLGGLYVGIH